MITLAVRENEVGTSKNLTHQAKLDAVVFWHRTTEVCQLLHEIGNVDIGGFEETLGRRPHQESLDLLGARCKAQGRGTGVDDETDQRRKQGC